MQDDGTSFVHVNDCGLIVLTHLWRNERGSVITGSSTSSIHRMSRASHGAFNTSRDVRVSSRLWDEDYGKTIEISKMLIPNYGSFCRTIDDCSTTIRPKLV